MPGDFSPNSPEIIAYFDIIKNSSLLHVFNSNMIDGHLMKMDFQLGIFSRGYLTYGFFLLGLFIGRVGYFRNYFNEIRLTKNVLYWSIGLFFVSLIIAFASFAQIAENVTFDNWPAMIGLTAFDINNLAMTFIIVCLFVLGYNKVKGKQWLNAFIPYGSIALTNYFLQSVIGTFIFYGWGLSYLGELRNAYSFLLAILIIILQMIISKWWLSKFYYGPLEWIWRSITYFKVYPLKRKK